MQPEVYYYQNGWPGAIGFPLPGAARGCGCGRDCGGACGGDCGPFPPPFPRPLPGPCDKGAPFFLDSANVIYHLFSNQITKLINLGLPNGTPAQTIFDTIDAQLGNINISTWAIPNLKSYFPETNFNSLKAFGQAVDTELGIINAGLIAVSGATFALTSTNTETIDFALSGFMNRNISANVNVSATSGNTLVVAADGLFAVPQALSVNYTNNQLTITNGNTVQLPNAPQGYLGNLSSDPASPTDGNTWYNTTSGQYKARLNGATRIITIT
jgi:hypothetical protein